MKKSWMLVCLPPVLGLLVFVLVRSAGSVEVPTESQINAAPSRFGGGGRVGRLDPSRLKEALRRAGVGQNASPETPTPSPTVRPRSASPSTKPGVVYKEDLIKRRYEGQLQNRRAHIRGIVVGIVVTVIGYAVVGFIFYNQYRSKPTWKDAIAAGKTAPTTDSEGG